MAAHFLGKKEVEVQILPLAPKIKTNKTMQYDWFTSDLQFGIQTEYGMSNFPNKTLTEDVLSAKLEAEEEIENLENETRKCHDPINTNMGA